MSPHRSLGITLLLFMFVATLAVATNPATIPCLSGFVRDVNGNPVVNGDLDFFQSATGIKLVTPGDNTDVFGFYNVCVLPGVYDVTYAPPPGTRLVGKRFDGVDLTGNVGKEMDVALAFGLVVSGTVTDSGTGAAIGGVDLDFDHVSGGRVYTPNDNSHPITGAYRAVVPAGQFRIRFDPPVGQRWRGLQLDSVTVAADTVIDVTLSQGVLLSGRVTDEVGQPLGDVSVDLRSESTGAKIFISNNKTGTDGNYTAVVPTGIFELQFVPPRGSGLVGAKVDSFLITSDQQWDQVLLRGVVLTVIAQDSVGNPVAGVDLDLHRESTGEKVFTPNDKTDSQGASVVAVLPDVYTLQLDPPPQTNFERLVLPGVSIQGDATLVLELSQVPRVNVTGRVTDVFGTGLAGIEIEAGRQPKGYLTFIPNNTTDSAGFYDIAIPVGTYDVFVAPPRGSRFVAARVDNVPVTQDTMWDAVALTQGVLFNALVVDDDGIPVRDADLDFIRDSDGTKAYTPHDNTDAWGRAEVALLPDTYTIVVNPPVGSPLELVTSRGVGIQSDSTVTLVLRVPVVASLLHPNYPNPFNATTTIAYEVAAGGQASVKVYNVLGQLIAILASGFHAPDRYTTKWNGTDRDGRRVASGVYFYRLETPQGMTTRRMVIVR